MLQLSLSQLFGPGASQSATALTIQKSALAAVGLTISANNRGESLLVALALVALKQWEGQLIDPSGAAVTDPDGKPLTYKQSRNLYKALNLFQWDRRFSQGKQRDALIVETFVTPPPNFGEPTNPNLF